jgi:hypothetical protein
MVAKLLGERDNGPALPLPEIIIQRLAENIQGTENFAFKQN